MNLVIRPFTSRDIEVYHELSHSSDDISCFVPRVVAKDQSTTATLVYQFENMNFQTEFAYIIEVKGANGTSQPVGALFASMEPFMNSLNVSYFIGNRHRKFGYMKKALQIFISYVKHETHFRSLVFDVKPRNAVSKRLIRSLGGESMGDSPFSIFETFERFEIKMYK